MSIRQIAVSTLGVGGLFFLLNACGPTTPATPPPAATACPATITAGVGGFVYTPISCTIKVNASVVIQASVTHPLVTTSSNWPTTFAGATSDQTITFTTAGTYTFQCQNHGGIGMKGTITVEN